MCEGLSEAETHALRKTDSFQERTGPWRGDNSAALPCGVRQGDTS